jgi:uncharacterized membrane protein YhhN
MTPLAMALLAVAGVIAVVDWMAVARRTKPLEYVAKPLTMVALIGVALTLAPSSAEAQRWFVFALAFGLLGDIFLMLPRNLFLAGLTAFLVGHVAYVAGFHALGVPWIVVALYGGLALLFGAVLVPAVVIGLIGHGKRALIPPVLLYSLVITAMLGSALASGRPLAAIGGVLFYASDTMIGYNRFVVQRAWLPLAIIVTYHLGQAAIVVSLAT